MAGEEGKASADDNARKEVEEGAMSRMAEALNADAFKVSHHDGHLRPLCRLGDEGKVAQEGIGRRGLVHGLRLGLGHVGGRLMC